ncbi:MAG: hypothetical protein IJU37_00235 [Desulfovibrio sp.]|nr:hypothetical protein [Desulfovibrio sp.]
MSQNSLTSPETLENAKHMVREIALELGYSPSQLDELDKRILDGEPLYKIVVMQESLVEERYEMALQMFKSGKLENAEAIFRWLCLFNGASSSNWMGLGACLHGQERWEEARTAYGMALAWSEENDPKPLYYLGVCNYMLHDMKTATMAFEEAVAVAGLSDEDDRELVKRACAMLEHIENKG